jgi:DnaJ-class molecular chaperone
MRELSCKGAGVMWRGERIQWKGGVIRQWVDDKNSGGHGREVEDTCRKVRGEMLQWVGDKHASGVNGGQVVTRVKVVSGSGKEVSSGGQGGLS